MLNSMNIKEHMLKNIVLILKSIINKVVVRCINNNMYN